MASFWPSSERVVRWISKTNSCNSRGPEDNTTRYLRASSAPMVSAPWPVKTGRKQKRRSTSASASCNRTRPSVCPRIEVRIVDPLGRGAVVHWIMPTDGGWVGSQFSFRMTASKSRQLPSPSPLNTVDLPMICNMRTTPAIICTESRDATNHPRAC